MASESNDQSDNFVNKVGIKIESLKTAILAAEQENLKLNGAILAQVKKNAQMLEDLKKGTFSEMGSVKQDVAKQIELLAGVSKSSKRWAVAGIVFSLVGSTAGVVFLPRNGNGNGKKVEAPAVALAKKMLAVLKTRSAT